MMDFQTPSPSLVLSELENSPRTSAMSRKNSRNLVYVKSKALFFLFLAHFLTKCEYKKTYKCRKLLFHDTVEFVIEGNII
jgi:hypothetical protein